MESTIDVSFMTPSLPREMSHVHADPHTANYMFTTNHKTGLMSHDVYSNNMWSKPSIMTGKPRRKPPYYRVNCT